MAASVVRVKLFLSFVFLMVLIKVFVGLIPRVVAGVVLYYCNTASWGANDTDSRAKWGLSQGVGVRELG